MVKELPDDSKHNYITQKGLRNTKALLKETLENEGETYSGNDDVDNTVADDEETYGIHEICNLYLQNNIVIIF